MDFEDKILFTYSIDHLSQKDKVRFHYALKGRNKPGMLKDCIQLGRGVILAPKVEPFKSFLEHWKCRFEYREIEVNEEDIHQLHS